MSCSALGGCYKGITGFINLFSTFQPSIKIRVATFSGCLTNADLILNWKTFFGCVFSQAIPHGACALHFSDLVKVMVLV